jgi:KDO2-lipid IV(A) lauroyltransferase
VVWRAIAALVAMLPWRWLGVPGTALGWVVGSALRIRRRHALQSMRRAGIPDASAALAAMYASLGTLVFELLWTAGRRNHAVADRVSVPPDQWCAVESALARGNGLVVATAHTGNWDLLACAMAARVPLMVVTRHLSWASLDRFWQALRSERGVVLVDARGTLGRASAHLRAGGVVAFLIDQRPLDDRGTEQVEFLGAPARYERAFADLAARCRAPVALALAERGPASQHRLAIPLLLDPPDRPSRAWVRQVVRDVAKRLDAHVRNDPGQWLWLHRRWG